jgi:hypothetical protein
VGWYRDQVLPRCNNVFLGGRELTSVRARVAASLDGNVLEIGFGSGLNVPHYLAAVTLVQAVDPATVGRKLAARRLPSQPAHRPPADRGGLRRDPDRQLLPGWPQSAGVQLRRCRNQGLTAGMKG